MLPLQHILFSKQKTVVHEGGSEKRSSLEQKAEPKRGGSVMWLLLSSVRVLTFTVNHS